MTGRTFFFFFFHARTRKKKKRRIKSATMDWRAAWLYRIEQAEGAATRARCATYLDDALRAGDFEKLKFLLLRNKGKGEAMNLGKLLRGGKGEQVCAACAATGGGRGGPVAARGIAA